MERGRELTALFYAGDTEGIAAGFTAEMDEALGGAEGVKVCAEQVVQLLGEELEVLDELVEEQSGLIFYTRTAEFSEAPAPFLLEWAFTPEGEIAGLHITAEEEPEAAPSQFLEYETVTELRLPFEGEWFVFWGGRDVRQNYHAETVDQRFAYDFVIVRDGGSHVGELRE